MHASYLTMTPEVLHSRAATLREMMSQCMICPCNCNVRRLAGEYGSCHVGEQCIVSSAGPHFGEESVLVGSMGSGTIFFSGCNLACCFCQNHDISQEVTGQETDAGQLADLMLRLQQRGCHNINLVSPTHVSAQAVEAIACAADAGLELPIVWNSGGYDSVDTLRLLAGIVDIYMPDVKYGDNTAGASYSGAPDYWDVARRAVREMHRQVGDLRIGPRGLARRGLLVRHLVLPNDAAGSAGVIEFLAEEISQDTFINVMDQFYPAYRALQYDDLSRRVHSREYRHAAELARSRGLRLAN